MLRSLESERQLGQHIYETIPGDEPQSYPAPPKACHAWRPEQEPSTSLSGYISMKGSEKKSTKSTRAGYENVTPHEPIPGTSTSGNFSSVPCDNVYTAETSKSEQEPCTSQSGSSEPPPKTSSSDMTEDNEIWQGESGEYDNTSLSEQSTHGL